MTDCPELELALLRETIEFLPEAVAIFDSEDRFVHWNRKYEEFYAWGAHLLRKGRFFEDYLRELLKLGRSPGAEGREEEWLAERMARHRLPFSHHEHEIAGGRWVRVEERRLAGGGTIGIRVDITELKRREMRLAYFAERDVLTGLANRTLLMTRLEAALAKAKDGYGAGAVLCLDLDRFKMVNDTLGHGAGDELLRQVAERLCAALRDEDTAARLGGDEFVVLLKDIGDRSDAEATAIRIVASLSQHYDLGEHHVSIGASAGIALLPLHGSDPETLLRHADIALYRAKAQGGGSFLIFEPVMNLRMQQRRILEDDLRTAIATPAIEVHYQPVVRLDTGEMQGVEALVRWRHSERGLVPPGDFIGIAEESGLIVPLGVDVLKQACRVAMELPGIAKVAVNLSPAQFQRGDPAEIVRSVLSDSGLDPHRLELEITESVLFANTEANLRALHCLKDFGVTIALDDFGTGFSSLSLLSSFPFDRIKVDRSFVREMAGRADCRAIIRAVIRLAADLDIAVTAEGVETEEQRRLLLAEGCRDGQGYLFDAAMPRDAIAQRLTGVGRSRRKVTSGKTAR